MSTTDQYPSYPLKFVTGDYKKWEVTITDPDPSSPDPDNPVMIPRDLTGWTARAQIRKDTKRDTVIMATLTTSGFGTDGQIILELPEDQSALVIAKSGWDLELTDPDGHAETILGGQVIPTLDYTR